MPDVIETLRQAVAEHGFQATNPMLAADALAKLDTLLQAAEAGVEEYARARRDREPFVKREFHDRIRVLAAAVRDVKGES